MYSRLTFAVPAICALIGFHSLSADEIRIAASDLLSKTLVEPFEAYGEKNNITIEVDAIGSLPALDRLRSDEIDVAIIAIPEGSEIPRSEFTVYPFAYEISVIAANESNPSNEISLSRLGGIFGSNEEFNFTSWGDLGLPGWGSRTIKPVVGLTDESIALELFKYSVLKSGTMRSSVSVVRDEEVESVLLSDAASIAIMSRLPESNKLKTIMISGASGGPAFGPTEDNVHYGDYPIRLAFYIVYHPRDEARMEGLLRVLMEDETADKLRADHFYPLPETVRRKLALDFDLKK